MSNRPHPRRLSPAQDDIAKVLGPHDAARIPGGCDQCDAYQMVVPAAPGVWLTNVYHDDWCPLLRYIGEDGPHA